MIQIAICFEDEQDITYITAELEACFQQRDIFYSILTFQNAEDMFKYPFETSSPDICIYSSQDIKMRIAVTNIKQHINPKLISIVFGNTNSFTNIEFTHLYPLFILNQKDRKYLWEALHKGFSICTEDRETFTFYNRPQYISTPIHDILYFASEARRIHLISVDHTHTFYCKLDELEQHLQFKQGQFIRIHKSFLVNSDFICNVTRNYIELTNGDLLRISNYDRYSRIMHEFNFNNIIK